MKKLFFAQLALLTAGLTSLNANAMTPAGRACKEWFDNQQKHSQIKQAEMQAGIAEVQRQAAWVHVTGNFAPDNADGTPYVQERNAKEGLNQFGKAMSPQQKIFIGEQKI